LPKWKYWKKKTGNDKGEIWWANLPDDPYGSEPGKRHPVVIIGNIILEKAVSGLEKTSVINFSQIATIDKTRLTEQVTMLPKKLYCQN
jgi:mRNA interferase MazF